jgi:hypothetical protein
VAALQYWLEVVRLGHDPVTEFGHDQTVLVIKVGVTNPTCISIITFF